MHATFDGVFVPLHQDRSLAELCASHGEQVAQVRVQHQEAVDALKEKHLSEVGGKGASFFQLPSSTDLFANVLRFAASCKGAWQTCVAHMKITLFKHA